MRLFDGPVVYPTWARAANAMETPGASARYAGAVALREAGIRVVSRFGAPPRSRAALGRGWPALGVRCRSAGREAPRSRGGPSRGQEAVAEGISFALRPGLRALAARSRSVHEADHRVPGRKRLRAGRPIRPRESRGRPARASARDMAAGLPPREPAGSVPFRSEPTQPPAGGALPRIQTPALPSRAGPGSREARRRDPGRRAAAADALPIRDGGQSSSRTTPTSSSGC